MTVPRFVGLAATAGVGVALMWMLQSRPPPAPVESSFEVREEMLPAPVPLAESVGMTLFPAHVVAGDSLVFLVDGAVLERPEIGAKELALHVAGHAVVASSESTSLGQRWVAVAGGFVAAPLLDRFAPPVDGTLPAGGEGMVAGRILPRGYAPADLDTVPVGWLDAGLGRVVLLRRPALEAFTMMAAAAAAEGISLEVVSGFRTGSYQATLYARQISRRGPFQDVSAPPGRSEHQLGTTLDLTAPGAPTLEPAFGETDAGRWIAANAAQWGFVVSFSRERHRDRRVSYEPWHVRWVDTNLDDESAW